MTQTDDGPNISIFAKVHAPLTLPSPRAGESEPVNSAGRGIKSEGRCVNPYEKTYATIHRVESVSGNAEVALGAGGSRLWVDRRGQPRIFKQSSEPAKAS